MLLSAVFAGAMWLASICLPSFALAVPGRWWLAAGFAVCGAVVALEGVLAFGRASTTVNPTQPGTASVMVTTGIYRFSRNPMYVGFALVLVGWACFVANLVAMLLVLAFVVYLNRFQIEPEERVLSARFGDEYRTYLRAVRRWL